MSNEKRGGMKIVGEIIDPSVVEAEKKADGIIERARVNEAIRVINELLTEVDSMVIPKRFSPTKKIAEGEPSLRRTLLPHLQDMTEQEYKREQLRRNLLHSRQEIIGAIGMLKLVILDMEATKQDDAPKEDTSTESPKA